MNGIEITTRKVKKSELSAIESFLDYYKTRLEGYVALASKSDVSVSSIQKAVGDKFLSEQIINKIIKAL